MQTSTVLVLASCRESSSFERFMQISTRHNCIGVDTENITVKEKGKIS